jgi:hypothetical protein
MKKVKFSNLDLPTPAKWSKLGLAIQSVSTFIAGYGLTSGNEVVGYIGLGCGILGTFLVTLTAE